MNYTKEQIEKMADEYANQFMDGKDHFYGFKAGFEKALSLFAVSGRSEQQCAIPDVRQRAMLWWDNLDDNLNDGFSKWKLGYKYYDRHWMSLTGREIEIIYKCEHVA